MGARLFDSGGLQALIIRRNIQHTDARAVLRPRQHDGVFVRLTGNGRDAHRRFPRIPNLVEHRTMGATDLLHAWRRRIFQYDSLASGIVPSDDTTEWSCGHDVSPVGLAMLGYRANNIAR